MDARLVLRAYYETHYGIHDHLSPDRVKHPLDGVLFREIERVANNGPLYDRLYQFAEKKYFELWGLNVEQFLKLPRYVIEMLEEIAPEVRKAEAAALSSLSAGRSDL